MPRFLITAELSLEANDEEHALELASQINTPNWDSFEAKAVVGLPLLPLGHELSRPPRSARELGFDYDEE